MKDVTVSEHYQSWNRNLDVVLNVNGKARSAKQIQDDREDAVGFMEIDMRGKPTAPEAEGPEYGSRKGNLFLSVFLIYRHAVFSNYRTELLDGRPMIVLDFTPGLQKNDDPLPVDHLCGTVWIDAADRVTTKLLARMTPSFGKSDPVFEQAYTRTTEGIWVGCYTRLNPSVNPEFFNNETYDWIIESHNYQRFFIEPTELKQLDSKAKKTKK